MTSRQAPASISPITAGWPPADSGRAKDTVTYTAAGAVTAGTIVTLTGLNLDDAGDQIIAYQGDPATPTILYVVDLADGNDTVAGDATNDNTTALPPGFALGLNAVAVRFRQCDLRRTEQGIGRRVVQPPSATRPTGSIATHWPRCSKS